MNIEKPKLTPQSRKKTINRGALMFLVIGLVGCNWIDNYDRREKYLEAEEGPPTEIPETLDKPDFDPTLPIPEANDVRAIAGKKLDIGLPPALSTTFGVEQIVLKKLDKDRWIFLDYSTARVWPKINKFWQENNLTIQRADPLQGIIESTWIIARAGDIADVYTSITSGTSSTDSLATIQHKFRLTIEPGIRSGSSEIYLKHKQAPLNAPVEDALDSWAGDSDNIDLENEVLTKLAYYLGDTINDPSVSLVPMSIYSEKAILVPDNIKPELRYRLSFNRAWATVEGALKNARIAVEDLNRSEAIFYVVFDEQASKKSGFLGNLFGGENDPEETESSRLQIHLTLVGDEVVATVMADETSPADAHKAERLLKIIKETSI